MRYASILFPALAVLAVLSRPAAAQVDVTACGQIVPAGQVGTLIADLDCSAATGDAVVLQAGATLALSHFRLIGNSSFPPGGTRGVLCEGRCTVLGPGTIEQFSGDGIFARGPIRVTGVTIMNNSYHGIEGDGLVRVSLTSAILYRNAGTGVYTGGNVLARESTFASNGGGVSGLGATVWDSTFDNNGVAVNSNETARIQGSSFTGNGIGVQAPRAILRRCTMQDNNIGINGIGRAVVRDTTITNSLFSGISAVSLRVRDSTVTGSGSGCTTPGFYCADLDTREQPLVIATLCGTSIAWQTHLPWGVCSAD